MAVNDEQQPSAFISIGIQVPAHLPTKIFFSFFIFFHHTLNISQAYTKNTYCMAWDGPRPYD
jgi:hypothetical protein